MKPQATPFGVPRDEARRWSICFAALAPARPALDHDAAEEPAQTFAHRKRRRDIGEDRPRHAEARLHQQIGDRDSAEMPGGAN